MVLFGHIGLTAGAFKLYERTPLKEKSRLGPVDYRFVLLGSDLPDLIDKPLGVLLFPGVFHNSRLFAHTLLFAALLMIIGGLIQRGRGHNGVLLLGIGSLIHLIFDSMWFYPKILFWPFLNIRAAARSGGLAALLSFPARPEGNWLAEDLAHLASDWFYLSSEIAGLLILAFYFTRLIRRKGFRQFFKNGTL